ncbi:(2Fe-2S)-binding protein [Reichenbachiella sp.]|uniref:(2Fe-2S)-binding protein n=1 Tax=Reichenbachiella sp. TaxID=2184521 RepID=UPI003BB08635
MAFFNISINGSTHSVDVEADTPLLWVLRDTLGMTGTKFGCGKGLCGACTVLLDDRPIRSCSLPVSVVDGKSISTIEAAGDDFDHVQEAWTELNVPQCGYCQSGQIMSAIGLLKNNANPSDEDIDIAMNGNLCRCGTYGRIKAAIKRSIEIQKS